MNGHELYRSDIDGLRAIAVLSVVLFHIDAAWVSGGFVGVDIFFVISGFLITKNIISEKEKGRFSLTDFYRRRIKRIIPALSTVIITTLIVAQFVFLPEDLERLSFSAIASQFSVANVYFTYFLDTSYFAQNASLEPLLHIWSLGVEEQFYIFWPLLIVAAINHFTIRTLWVVVLVTTAMSFIAGEALLDSYASFSYYMLPSRAGELLAGALVYFALRTPNLKLAGTKIIPEVISFVGLLLIGLSLFLLNEESAFPGYNAIAVTLGTALLIFGNGLRTTFVSQALSWRPFVAIGLVSYSLYLWHWPVLSFAQYIYGEGLSLPQQLIAVAIMILLTLLSYFFIEQATRKSNKTFLQILVRQFVVPTVGIVMVSVSFILTNGYGLYDLNKEYKVALAKSTMSPVSAGRQNYICGNSPLTEKEFNNPDCVINGYNQSDVLLWGGGACCALCWCFG